MKTITVNRNGNAYLTPESVDIADNLVKIVSGSGATVNIIPIWGYSVGNQRSTVIMNGQTLTLRYDNNYSFNYISGSFKILPQQIQQQQPQAATIGPVMQVSFVSIANQADYNFDGTVTAWNPNGLNLIGNTAINFSSDGLNKVVGTNYTWSSSSGTVSVIGKIYDDVQYILFYQ